MTRTRQAVTALATLLQLVPPRWRARVWAATIALGALGTLIVLALPHAEIVGLTVPEPWVAAITALAAVLGALARANTPPDPAIEARRRERWRLDGEMHEYGDDRPCARRSPRTGPPRRSSSHSAPTRSGPSSPAASRPSPHSTGSTPSSGG